MNADFDHTKACVDYYRKLGLCPLPSRMDFKKPWLPTYAEHYGPTPVPGWVYEQWATTNVQIITGTKTSTPTRIIVVNLDGPEALEAWGRITERHGYRPSRGWVATTGGGGRHHYFRLPPGVEVCPSGIIWGLLDSWGKRGRGEWLKHKEIRILGDNALVVAPPSIHVDTGIRYKFDDDASPKLHRLPEVAPGWLLNMPRLFRPRFGEPTAPRRDPAAYEWLSDNYYERTEVLDAVGNDKFDIARREWGLISTVEGPNPNGWCPCYVPGREEPRYSRPSGSFHFRDGTFQDRKDLSSISFFDLAVALGAYQTWQECRDALGDRYIGKRRKEASFRQVSGILD
jgi:Bifunctional DNA primase/polymerase, N-terminal